MRDCADKGRYCAISLTHFLFFLFGKTLKNKKRGTPDPRSGCLESPVKSRADNMYTIIHHILTDLFRKINIKYKLIYAFLRKQENPVAKFKTRLRVLRAGCRVDLSLHGKDKSTASHQCCIQHTLGVSEHLFFIAGSYPR